MRVYSRYKALKESACYYARELGIQDSRKIRVHIYRLPHPHPKQGYIEYPIHGKLRDISIYVKLDDEREITLAHEMVHVRQVLARQGIDEVEAEKIGQKIAEKRLTMTLF
jgi:hypothetical protein|tara:strand:- start:79 stop:408 length:330 start_codon:yes stop_codon:yes gene_type:complete